jgi:hypothetical protein
LLRLIQLFNIFFAKYSGSEATDYSIVDAAMTLIWAVGQQVGKYVHKPKSGLEVGTAAVEDFYRPDEVKYHGRQNRGFTMANFYGKKIN